MKNEGLSDRAEKLMMGIPAVLVGLLVAALFWSGCERAAAPRIPESAPIIIPISPDEALDKSEAEATGRVNRGLSQSDMNHWLPKAVATRIGSAFRAKGWVIDEHPGSHGDVWLTFSWPEGKP